MRHLISETLGNGRKRDRNQDETLKEVFETFTSSGASWFDTGDSYGTGELEGAASGVDVNAGQGSTP